MRTTPARLMMSCVDSRSEEPLFGTPGGDMSEVRGGWGLGVGCVWERCVFESSLYATPPHTQTHTLSTTTPPPI